MPDGQTQSFKFVTDSLKAVESVLRTMVPIFFYEGGKYTQLHFRPRPNRYLDDKDYKNYWALMKPIVEVEPGKYVAIKDNRTFSGAKFCEIVKTFTDQEKAAEWAVSDAKKNEPQPSSYLLATLSDYKDRENESDKDFKNHEEMIDYTVNYLKSSKDNSVKDFENLCGDGYSYAFNHDDGDVSVGYYLWHSPTGAFNNLNIGLTHIYYGK